MAVTLPPRFIRLRDAPTYLCMDKNLFNQLVRPGLTEIPIGQQGVAFDRHDLDAWADRYKETKGRPCKVPARHAAPTKTAAKEKEFHTALGRVTERKRKKPATGAPRDSSV